MKAARATVVTSLTKHFPKDKATRYEKAMFGIVTASMSEDDGATDLDDEINMELYASIAYERIAQLINAKNETDRLIIVVDMQRQASEGPYDAVSWSSTVYDDYKDKYESTLNRSQQRPKPVKGAYICKDPKCKSDEFYMWSSQTRGGDEGMTNFRQCARCGKRNKE
jgi:DNA-directed RNA polymerase subunit M/transcription elongation factor TFIIS